MVYLFYICIKLITTKKNIMQNITELFLSNPTLIAQVVVVSFVAIFVVAAKVILK